ncbi:putative aminopeptidase [Desulfosporosinus acidiphilus SJ4]|uniref:Putative aminopeptidase n=1 Tax=Desulfosporosinus acidiphilus (strain DSM 22704 / JCM 16185 / SJ4) TaxID=646529 RepID=I4D7K8_DESAJ|nr:M20/M25/M40 family metallo-hydrolase [Desulfosporosinus acidiphilus]AFM41782.1 putative aminopeptidase [Desulfosporosinus acidiphilus SJ4]
MPTRRRFIKCLIALGAGLLPWSGWSEMLKIVNHQAAQAAILTNDSSAKTLDLIHPKDVSYLYHTAADDISALTASDFQGRRAGTVGEEKAAAYLIEQMKGLGLEPLGDLINKNTRNYSNAFTVYPVIEEFYNGRLTFRPGNSQDLRTPCANVIGGIMGKNKSESVILSAHFDHLGIFQGHLYPGANDNASGVGCILDLVRQLVQEGVKPKCNIVLAFWSAEEMGFVGSFSFLQNPTFSLGGLKAVFNVDTIGNGALNDFSVWASSDNEAVQAIQSAASEHNISIPLASHEGYNSDQVYFNLDHLPAVTLMARDWLNKNHTPDDVPDFVNPEKVALANKILYKAVKKIAY